MKQNYLFRRTLSAIVLLLASTLAWAYDFEAGDFCYNIIGETSVEVAYRNDYYAGNVIIPAAVSYDGHTYNVTSIGYSAFGGCSSLTSIDIPAGVTSIRRGAFAGCSSLSSITVSADNPVYDSREGCNAIIETSSNTLIAGCKNTIIPESVTSIGDFAFAGCSSLSSIVIPAGVTSIGDCVFASCSSLSSIVIPDGVTSIGDGVFDGCESLSSIVIPASVTSIRYGAFHGCSSLTSIDIPAGVTSIGKYAFYYCSSLTSIALPAGLTSIGSSAFVGCSSLTSIDLPAGLTSIGDDAFYGCSSLTSVICRAESVPSISGDTFYNVPLSNATLYVPASAIECYMQAEGWNIQWRILPIEGGTGIDSPVAWPEYDDANGGEDSAAPYYTLDGKPVGTPTRKGIYIKNGRKVLY